MSEAETIAAALALPQEARADLALRLVESLNGAVAEVPGPDEGRREARAELDRRWDATEAGAAEPVPAADGLAQVLERLRRAR